MKLNDIQNKALRERAKYVWRSLDECGMRNQIILKWARYCNEEIDFEDFTSIEKTWIRIRLLDPGIH